MTFYLFHQGSEANHYYSLYLRQPRVTRRMVPSEATGLDVPLYESPDSFIFNFCLNGFERRTKVRCPLGSVTKLKIDFEELAGKP